jgi:cleavage and polyadenylation specificity factor subunit 3
MNTVARSDNEVDNLTIMPLGGGQEVGRSCILIQFQGYFQRLLYIGAKNLSIIGRTVMLDCGSHPGRDDSDHLPLFDCVDDIEAIDLVLVTHFHIDHCASLPYFTEKTHFKGYFNLLAFEL